MRAIRPTKINNTGAGIGSSGLLKRNRSKSKNWNSLGSESLPAGLGAPEVKISGPIKNVDILEPEWEAPTTFIPFKRIGF